MKKSILNALYAHQKTEEAMDLVIHSTVQGRKIVNQ